MVKIIFCCTTIKCMRIKTAYKYGMKMFRLIWSHCVTIFLQFVVLFQNVDAVEDCRDGRYSFYKELTREFYLKIFKNISSSSEVSSDVRMTLYHLYENRRDEVCSLVKETMTGLFCFSEYKRIYFSGVILKTIGFYGFHILIHVKKPEISHGGFYLVFITEDARQWSMCFTVYIIGPPTSDITGLEEETEEGQSLLLKCSSNSTTVPETHNLKMETMWYLDGRVVESRGRFRVCDDELTIDSVMKTDNNLEISCRAKEQMGLTTWTNKSLHVNWGPDPVVELEPPQKIYQMGLHDQLPVINCHVDCNPPCDVRWSKIDSQSGPSTNGTLILGNIGKDSFGEHYCLATRNGTRHSGIASVLIMEEKVSGSNLQNYQPVLAMGMILAILALSTGVLTVLLLKRRTYRSCQSSSGASQTEDSIEMMPRTTCETNIRLNHETHSERTYDALNHEGPPQGDESIETMPRTRGETYERLNHKPRIERVYDTLNVGKPQRNDSIETTPQTRGETYERLNHEPRIERTYDALNVGLQKDAADSQNEDKHQLETDLYRNAVMTSND